MTKRKPNDLALIAIEKNTLTVSSDDFFFFFCWGGNIIYITQKKILPMSQ